MKDDDFDKPATIAAAMVGVEPSATGDITPHIKPSTTYTTDQGFSYYRDSGPGMVDTEAVLARLEAGADAMLFSSGMAAATHLLMALGPGSHVLAPETMYWFLRSWMIKKAPALGLEISLYPNGDLDAVKAGIRTGETMAVWAETPANPDWSIMDLTACAEIAHEHGAKLFVDSTSATPVLTRPLDLGADVVMHSATKYLNGHSDVLAGALVTGEKDELWQSVREVRTGLGSTLGAMEAWLLLRGMRTLDVRMKRHCENAMRVALAMRDHPGISDVLYPGLPGHPGHEVAAKQMQGGFGGMMSIRLKGGEDAAARAAKRTRLFKPATSLGGTESLIEHRGPVEGPDSPCPMDLLRLSVGLEDADDLIADLEQALGQ